MSYLLPYHGTEQKIQFHTPEEVDKINKLLETECMKQIVACLARYTPHEFITKNHLYILFKKPCIIVWLNGDSLEVHITLYTSSDTLDIEIRQHLNTEQNRSKMPGTHLNSVFKLGKVDITPDEKLNEIISKIFVIEQMKINFDEYVKKETEEYNK